MSRKANEKDIKKKIETMTDEEIDDLYAFGNKDEKIAALNCMINRRKKRK